LSSFGIIVQAAVRRPPRLGVWAMGYSLRHAIVHDLDSLVASPMRVH
jgi:hypothetical protein